MCKRNVYLAGIGMGDKALLTSETEQILRSSDCVIGAGRLLEAAKEFLEDEDRSDKKYFQSYDPEEIHAFISEHKEYSRIVVALSGDPGFYSGAKRLETELQEFSVRVLPGISSVVYLAAKLHTSWDDAELASAHGRRQNYIQKIKYSQKTFLLLGGKDCGAEVCRRLKEYHLEHVQIFAGKNLSYANEEIIECRAEELKPDMLEGLCTAMIWNPAPSKRIRGSVPDVQWIRGNVPMTKEEVRAVSIGKLRLTDDAVLYDIGAGTGSVSIEAALLSERIRVYAVEKKEEALHLIMENRRKFGTDGVCEVAGTAPDILQNLEPPTHVFIGGSSGSLKEILTCVKEKNPEVRIVINAISLETLKEVTEAAEEGLLGNPEIVQISAARSKVLGNYHMMTGQNPVFVISDGGISNSEDETTDK